MLKLLCASPISVAISVSLGEVTTTLDLVPLITSGIGDSELIIIFKKRMPGSFPICYNKQGIQSNFAL